MPLPRYNPSHKCISPGELNEHLEFIRPNGMPFSYDPSLLAGHTNIHRNLSKAPSKAQLKEFLMKLVFTPNHHGYKLEVFKRQSSKFIPLIAYHIAVFKQLWRARCGARGFFLTPETGVFETAAGDSSDWNLSYQHKLAPPVRFSDSGSVTAAGLTLQMSKGGVTEELNVSYETDMSSPYDPVFDDRCYIHACITFTHADGRILFVHTDGNERGTAHITYTIKEPPAPEAAASANAVCWHSLRITYATQSVAHVKRTERGRPSDKVLIAMLGERQSDGSWRNYCSYGAPRHYTAMPKQLGGNLEKRIGRVFFRAQLQHKERWEREAKTAYLQNPHVPVIVGDNGAWSEGWDLARENPNGNFEDAFAKFMNGAMDGLKVDEERDALAKQRNHSLFLAAWISYSQKFRRCAHARPLVPEAAAKRRCTE